MFSEICVYVFVSGSQYCEDCTGGLLAIFRVCDKALHR